ncbi:MAG: DNA repair protein RadA [Gammaproteobacteria bacterium]|nr:DNA repair protein RadA [Gammaproteobacteria bacterium]
MAVKSKLSYQCADCGALHNKWTGQCADCGAWNTLSEVVTASTTSPRFSSYAGESAVQTLAEVNLTEQPRTLTGLDELDRVLGGGVVRGSVVLIGGDPGIGKSTLLLQMTGAMGGADVLYVSGEESAQQTSLRARRLGLAHTSMLLLTETGVERILATAAARRPRVMVIDSIQTLYTDQLQSASGSVSQVRECAAQLVRYAKQTDTTVFLVGHVTKEGALAGPRVLEHMVDTVLYFEGDSGERYRVLRAVKNRFGAVNELGVFAMSDRGLKGVSNPSAIFLSHHEEPVPGSVVMVTREGTRPMLVEIQALVDESHVANPRRVAVGLDYNRLAMLLAVLHRHGGIAMYDQDVFVNAVGGMRINETGADLAVLLAALSSFRNKPLPADLVVFGEVGLAGEIRPVPNGQERLKEASKHGFKRAIIPKDNVAKKSGLEMQIIGARRLSEAIDTI